MTQKYFDEANAKKKVLGWARVEIEGTGCSQWLAAQTRAS